MNLPLSSRLAACCSYVNQCGIAADIGCDHGYVGINLLLSGRAEFVYASDISKPPLQSAMRNALKFGVSDRMRFFLSNGLAQLPRDFETMVCAGMGADTMIAILSAAPWLKSGAYRMVLQCQSRRAALRAWLSGQGFSIQSEMLAQDGKFLYPVMEVVYAPNPPLTPAQCLISPALLHSADPLLPAFYARVRGRAEMSLAGVTRSGDSEKAAHYRKILEELTKMEETIHANSR